MPALVSVTASGSSAPSPRVVIVGAAGFTNLGDDAILRAMLAELRGVLPGPAFIVAGGPHPVAEPGIEWIHVRDIRAVDAAIARADFVIVGGGGFIYDYDAILTPRDYFRGDIPVTRPMTELEISEAYEKNTGLVIAETFTTNKISPEEVPAVLVANHAPFTWGRDGPHAIELARVLELVARLDFRARVMAPDAPRPDSFLIDKHYFRKHGAGRYYGQK